MLPQVHGGRETRLQIVWYTLALTALTLLPSVRGFGPLYLAAALVLGAIFIALALLTLRDRGTRWARRTFEYSIIYLALLFAAMVVDVFARR